MKRLTLRMAIALFTFVAGIGATTAWLARSRTPVIDPVNVKPLSDRPEQEGNASSGKQMLEMVFVLDTTGSMGGLLEGAKQRIWAIVNDVMQSSSRPAVRIGLVAYRDHGDEYVTKVLPLTEDLDKVFSTLMDYRAAGGGDEPEDVRRALADGVHRAGWSRDPSVAKILFLVGDAPPHDDYLDEPDTATSAGEAVRMGIIINTIQCGNLPGTKAAWQAIAQRGQGQYFSIAHDGGVQTVATPYDERLGELGRKLGGTYLAYGGGGGSTGERHRAEAAALTVATETTVAANANSATRADRALNKALNKDAYAGDLLQALENGTVKPDAIKDEDLPDDLKRLPPAARRQEIEKRLAERRQLRAEILALAKQREEFIAAERRKRSAEGKQGSFDVAVSAALKEQLARKGNR